MGLSKSDLLALERRGWDALCDGTGAEFYGELMTADGVMVLVGGLVLERDDVVESLSAAPPWSAYELSDVRYVRLGEFAAALTYRAVARRGDEPPFHALMASSYTLVDGMPRLALYQQTLASK